MRTTPDDFVPDHDGALEDPDEQHVGALVVGLDLRRELTQQLLDLRLREEHLLEIARDVFLVHGRNLATGSAVTGLLRPGGKLRLLVEHLDRHEEPVPVQAADLDVLHAT